jgi:hypothetical protein
MEDRDRLRRPAVFVLLFLLTAASFGCTPGPGTGTPGATASPTASQPAATPTEEPIMVPDADFYVSPRGRTEAAGTADDPFGTLKAAKSAVRKKIAEGMAKDVLVVLRGGEYHLERTETFIEKDGGRDGFRVRYVAAPGEKPVIIGGKRIGGWEIDAARSEEVERKHPGAGYKVYRSAIGPGMNVACLYEREFRLVPARSPDYGYFTTESADKDDPVANFRYREGDVAQGQSSDGLRVMIWPGSIGTLQNNWHTNTIAVDSIDSASRKIRLGGIPYWKLTPGNRYFLEGREEFLDFPGEFWYDRKAGVLYVVPTTPVDPDSYEVELPTAKTVVAIAGSDRNALVRDLTFQGIEFRTTDGEKTVGREEYHVTEGALSISFAEGIEILDCRIRNTGFQGIVLHGYAQGCRLEGNRIADTGYNGIALIGKYLTEKTEGVESPKDGMWVRDNVIRGNLISQAGRLIGHSHGIYLYLSGDNLIERNTVYHTTSNAITLHGALFGYMAGSYFGFPVTPENYDEFCYTRNNIVRDNDIFDAMYDGSDGGLIGGFGTSGNTIERNFVHDATAVPKGGLMGIYLDDGSNFWTVRNNIVSRVGTPDLEFATIFMLKGIDILVENNKAFGNTTDWGMIGVVKTPAEAYSTGGVAPAVLPDTRGAVIRRNLLSENSTEKKGRLLYLLQNYYPGIIKESSDNLVFTTLPLLGAYGSTTLPEWKSWGLYPMDKFMSFEDGLLVRDFLFGKDPGFMDPAHDDYRLMEDSPAFALGFQDFDLSGVGIGDGSPLAQPLLVHMLMFRDSGGGVKADVRIRGLAGAAGSRLRIVDPYRMDSETVVDLKDEPTTTIRNLKEGATYLFVVESYDASGALVGRSETTRSVAAPRETVHERRGTRSGS